MKDKNLTSVSRTFRLENLDIFFHTALGLVTTAELFAVGVLSYLGVFSRYLADDYCETVILRNGSLLSLVFNNYLSGQYRASNRFSNLIFVGLTEFLGDYKTQILPFLMMLAWLIGLTWLVNQFRRLVKIRLPLIVDFFMASSIVFFSVWQAPNRFQTFLWRSSMATHFAPIVFMSFVGGFILLQVRSTKKTSLWALLTVFIISFLVSGFSEPATMFMIAAVIIALLVIWRWGSASIKQPAIPLLLWTLIGALLSLVVMFFSPGNFRHGTSSLSTLPEVLSITVQYAFAFMGDTIRALPLPSLLSVLIPFLVFLYVFRPSGNYPLVYDRNRLAWMAFVFLPLTQCLLIAASFAPSVYGQSYPADRARFLGYVIMTTGLIFEGAILGAQVTQHKILFFQRPVVLLLGNVLLLALAIYPFRAGLVMWKDVPEYREWALAWDARENQIYKSIAMGEQDLVMKLFPARAGIKEIDGNPQHWINRCVADYYNVHTVRSVPMDGE